MINVQKYIVDGTVAREKIAMDIKYRSIKKNDIEILIKDPVIKKSFFGDGYADKISRNKWDKEYLEKLSYAVVSEAFNSEYLLYLDEVADKVSKDNSGLLRKRHPVIISLLIVCIICLFTFLIYKATR